MPIATAFHIDNVLLYDSRGANHFIREDYRSRIAAIILVRCEGVTHTRKGLVSQITSNCSAIFAPERLAESSDYILDLPRFRYSTVAGLGDDDLMAMSHTYENVEPARAQIDELEGPVVVEFGTPWCGHCAAAQQLLEVAFAAYPLIRHIKIEDGPRRRLGRSFRVKLWPTLIFINNGREVARLVRPRNAAVIIEALKQFG